MLSKTTAVLGIIGISIGICAGVQSFFVIPYVQHQHTDKIAALELRREEDRELLVRMEERIKTLQRAMKIPVSEEGVAVLR